MTVILVIVGILILGIGFPPIYAPSFMGLGDLPGGDFVSTAEGISPEGSAVVGRSFSENGLEAYRWTETTGIMGLGDFPGGRFESFSLGTSSDGLAVVGQGNSASGSEAFRWTEGTGMVGLGDLPGGAFSSRAWGVSADGSVVVGQGRSASGSEAFRWTQGTGMVGLGDLPGGSFVSVAQDVSADGSVVVGFGRSGLSPQAFRWTEGTGMVGIGFLPGGFPNSVALGVSADGNVIVGFGRLPIGFEAFRWTEGTGMVGLGDLPGGSFTSQANAASADGSVIVGFSNSANGNVPFVWDSVNGMQDLKTVLTDAGIDLTGITLFPANDVSDDGCVVVGFSRDLSGRTEAYRADICGIVNNPPICENVTPNTTNSISSFASGVVITSSTSTSILKIGSSPSHKTVEIGLSGVTDPDGDPTTLTIDGITQDEPTTGSGKGDKSPDGLGVGTDTATIRAERLGTGDGRVYEISFTADDGNGGMCSGSVFVAVPHDNKKDPIDSGQNFDSTLP